MQMLKACKYTKFREVNFKVLVRILVTPKVKKNPVLANCPWCKGIGTLEHILLTCSNVHKVRHKIWHYNKHSQPGPGAVGFLGLCTVNPLLLHGLLILRFINLC